MKKIILAVAMIASFSAYATQPNWVSVSTSNDVIFFIDTNSIQREVGKVTFWEYAIFTTPAVSSDWEKSVGTAGVMAYKVQYAMQCTAHTMQQLASVQIGLNGKTIGSDSGPDKSASIVPNSVGDEMQHFVCKK